MGNPVISMQLATVGFMWGGGSREIYRGSPEQTPKPILILHTRIPVPSDTLYHRLAYRTTIFLAKIHYPILAVTAPKDAMRKQHKKWNVVKSGGVENFRQS